MPSRRKRKRHGACESCGNVVDNLCAVTTVVELCQRDAKTLLLIEGAYLEVRVKVAAPERSEATNSDGRPA